jgi:hypothetical protein
MGSEAPRDEARGWRHDLKLSPRTHGSRRYLVTFSIAPDRQEHIDHDFGGNRVSLQIRLPLDGSDVRTVAQARPD